MSFFSQIAELVINEAGKLMERCLPKMITEIKNKNNFGINWLHYDSFHRNIKVKQIVLSIVTFNINF